MSARTRFNRRPSQEALAAIQANLTRAPERQRGRHAQPWTAYREYSDCANQHRDKKPGRHQLDQSPTAPKVYPFNPKTMTEAEWLGRTA